MERRGLLDIGKVGLVPLSSGVGTQITTASISAKPGEIAGRREMLGANVLLDSGAGDMSDIALALIELFDLAGIGIEADHTVPSFGKAQAQAADPRNRIR